MPGKSAKEPVIYEKPSQTMAVVVCKGNLNTTGEYVFPALFGAVYGLKMSMKKSGLGNFTVTGLRARWPDAHLVTKDEWTAIWALPIPDGTESLPKKVAEPDVKIEVWEYGTVAEILHIGPYTEEGPTVERLHKFIEESGYELSGAHEEEYLTSPKAKVQKTLIRYVVKRKI
ncbi:MAG: GyrI-like domain-containing protein [Armatimonadota bacterium]